MRSGRMPIALLNARNLPKWSLTHTGTADPVSPGRKVIYRGMWFAHTLITPHRSSRNEEQAMNASSGPDKSAPNAPSGSHELPSKWRAE